jgi:hypothetical protein
MPLPKSEKAKRLMGSEVGRTAPKSIGTKVTTEEEAELSTLPADGEFISEWVRDELLRTARGRTQLVNHSQ